MRPPAKCHPDRPNVARGMCQACYGQFLYQRNRKKYIDRSTVWHRENRDRTRKWHSSPALEGDRKADCHPEMKHYARGLCMKCYDAQLHRESYPQNREKRKTRSKKWYHENKERVRIRDVAKKFNLPSEEYKAMVERQHNLCAICGGPPKQRTYLCVDHCHSKDKTRELLCITCNAGLGQFYDDPELLEKAAAYLRKHEVLF